MKVIASFFALLFTLAIFGIFFAIPGFALYRIVQDNAGGRSAAPAAVVQAAAHTQSETQTHKDDLVRYYQEVIGDVAPCDAATAVVADQAKAIAAGGGDLVTAYRDAQTAEQACEQASSSIASVPDSLQGLGLDEGVKDLTTAMKDKQYAASDAQDIFNGTADTAKEAEFSDFADESYRMVLAGTLRFLDAGNKMGVDLSKVKTVESAN